MYKYSFMVKDEDLDKLLENLPLFIKEHVNNHPDKEKIVEIIMDLGRRPEARFTTGPQILSQKMVSWQDIEYTTKRINKFNNENRAGIERTLHRISCIRNRQFLITGLTCRIGRAVFGTITLARDLLESNKSILILGKPGVGKTTIIREIARVLSDEMGKRVIIIDTANEIGGNSDIPHPGIGRSRRMQVSETNLQHQVMIEAVENHMPEVIIIDEIGTELEASAARTIAEKGVQLVGTTHGNCLENLIKNPPLADLIGGIQYVTLSDEEAKRRGTQKSILERKSYPAFQIAIEINEHNNWIIHENVQESVDLLLRGNYSSLQTRQFVNLKKIMIKYKMPLSVSLFTRLNTTQTVSLLNKEGWQTNNLTSKYQVINSKHKRLFVYPFSISQNLVKEIIAKLELNIGVTKEIQKANFIIGLKKSLHQNLYVQNLAKQKKIPIYVLKSNSIYQVAKLIQFIVS